MTQASGTQLPKRSKTVSSWERGTGTTIAPRQVVGSQASWRPCGSNATEGPAIEACTTGRPDSTARTAASAPCCCGPQVLWKAVVAVLRGGLREAGHPAEQRPRGDVLAEGHQPDLVVAGDRSVRPDQQRALVDTAGPAPGVDVGQHVRAGRLDHPAERGDV